MEYKKIIEELNRQRVSASLIKKVEEYNKTKEIKEDLKYRIPKEDFVFIGKEIWEQALTAILQGANLLLMGPKSTGKNLLASNLAQIFKSPSWNISFHVNTDEGQLLGLDSFVDNQVIFRDGPITASCRHGGFVILDEINMAKNEALSVLHSSLDDRRIIDIPGYDLINIHPNTRFIATMNYGYLGTRDLNEALISRFLVIEMPQLSHDELLALIIKKAPDLTLESANKFVSFFKDLELKVDNAEISSKALDLRGLLSAIESIRIGLELKQALRMALSNKTFDSFEKELIEDLIRINFPKSYLKEDIFE